MRANVAEQQARILNETGSDPTAPPPPPSASCRKKKGGAPCHGHGRNESDSRAAGGEEGARPPSEEATGAFDFVYMCDDWWVLWANMHVHMSCIIWTETAPHAQAEAADTAANQTASDNKSKPQKQKKRRVEFVPVEWFDAIRADDSLTRRVRGEKT